MEDETTVMVPVPVWLLSEVYELLGRRMRQQQVTQGPDLFLKSMSVMEARDPYWGAGDELQAQRQFSAAELGLLKRTLEDKGAARSLLDRCALSPGVPIAFEEIVNVTGLEPKLARGQLGALTKILKRLFRSSDWPVQVQYGTQGQATYMMPEGMARIWREL